MTRLMKLLVLSLVATVAIAGCNEKEKTSSKVTTQQQPARASSVVVPDSVKGKWKAVKIAVADKNANRQKVYELELGKDFKLPDSDITLTVVNFLPNFVMEGTTLTSISNELKNPAAQLVISEGKKEIFKGWLFTLYPTTHAFQHPQFGFTLVDYEPAK
ncbi:lipoprotein [Geomonas limicola]|uniref:Lipoprotein n=1 Tax=Geomonas limicola TaxID=2740186 RepID=A0A6V8N5H0_9BACT|nr:lipoprotein [Geomonas limicola]